VALDLNHLESLVAVAECGSIAKAAGRLHKVRSAVSYDIRCLEQHLGVTLLDRTGYRARLTDAGHALRKEGEQILNQARSLEHRAGLIGQEWEPTIRVVLEGAIPIPPIMRAIKIFTASGAPTQIELQTDFLGGVAERFEREEADLMLVKDFDVSWDEYVVHRLPDIHCALVAASDHPVFERDPLSVTVHDLSPHLELNIQVPDEPQGRMTDRRVGVPRTLNLGGFFVKREALLMGLGFGWMPRTLITRELGEGTLREIPLAEGAAFQFTPSLMHRKDRPLGRAGAHFVQLLLDEFESLH